MAGRRPAPRRRRPGARHPPGPTAHEHADLRFFLSTRHPEAARPERPGAELRWLSVPEALELATEANVRETIRRAARLFPVVR